MDVLVLEDGRTRAGIVPALGGGIAFLEGRLSGRRTVPVLRPWTGRPEDGPFALACNMLLPFSNRISGGGFPFGGTFHEIAPNLAGEPFPIHGDGFQKAWEVERADARSARLFLREGGIGPFRYEARLELRLEEDALDVRLAVTSTAARKLPFGAGFHPWFPRDAATTLRFPASGIWLEDERHLPTRRIGLAKRPQWDFSCARPQPEGWINNAFTGWSGEATVVQPLSGIAVDIGASSNLDTAILYSPGREADFFCFEPVSHAVDAHNQSGQPGLEILAAGETLAASMRLAWREIP